MQMSKFWDKKFKLREKSQYNREKFETSQIFFFYKRSKLWDKKLKLWWEKLNSESNRQKFLIKIWTYQTMSTLSVKKSQKFWWEMSKFLRQNHSCDEKVKKREKVSWNFEKVKIFWCIMSNFWNNKLKF